MSEEFTILEEGVTDAAPPAAEAGTETVAAGAEASATPESVPYERFQKQNHDFRALQENHTQLQGKFEQVGQWVRKSRLGSRTRSSQPEQNFRISQMQRSSTG